jgi:UbiD family decarboxylase
MFDDLRAFVQQVEKLGDLRVIRGADWDLEIGAVTELQKSVQNSPLLLFDHIKDYPEGYRIVANIFNTPRRFNLSLGLPLETVGLEQVMEWRKKTKRGVKLIPPAEVSSGPVKEHVHVGKDVNLFEFPTPKWHEHDGGRYIGTGCVVVQKDPEEGWVNLGTYRVQVHDENTATVHIVDGHHGDLIRKKYWTKGQAAPAAVVCGQDPLLWYVASTPFPWGTGEYDYAGWLRNRPVEVVRGEVTGLPVPAAAEIVLEGELVLPGGETRVEGPFGEWEGYYAGKERPEPVFKVKAILHRKDPILLGAPPSVGAFENGNGRHVMGSAELWDELDKQMAGIRGVWMPPEARGTLMVVISMKQMYSGHAQRAAMIASGWYGTAWMNRFIVIVDDDINPSNIGEVLWALTTRCDPQASIDILRGCWGARSDPLLSPEKRRLDQIDLSKAILYACKPYHWIKNFPPAVKSSPELLAKVKQKFFEK